MRTYSSTSPHITTVPVISLQNRPEHVKSRKYYELQNLDRFTLTPEEIEERRRRNKEYFQELENEKEQK